jgi:hypothetical protein
MKEKRYKMNSSQILEREFLEMRARILELAASLDRIDRAEGNVSAEPAMIKLVQGMELLCDGQADRAQRAQLLFSREYQDNWQEDFQIQPRFQSG